MRGAAAPREQVVRHGSSLPEVGAGGPHTPMRGRSAPPPRVTFPSRGKSPKARQNLRFWTPSRFQQNFGNLTQSGSRDGTLALSDWKPQPSLSALFALAALRSGSRRAGFYHRKRPICHFEMVGESVFVVSFGFDQEKYSAVNPWLGRGLVARLGATLGAIRGIGEGGSSNESATKSLQPTRIRRYSKMFFDCRTSRSPPKKRLVAGWLQAGCRPGCS